VAAALGQDPRDVIARLSGSLSRQHRPVRLDRLVTAGATRLARHSFAQHLVWRYLHAQLDAAQRAVLLEAVQKAHAEMYSGDDPALSAGALAVTGLPESEGATWGPESAMRVV
jgi:hypothetical protein